ncbi:oligoendopeptidase F [bacterium]|nr:MAG: oligoendopeptidase F [bacterium]
MRLIHRFALMALMLCVALPALAEYTPDPNAARDDVPGEFKWDLGQLFSDEAAWQASMDELGGQVQMISAYEGKLAVGADLQECLTTYFDLHNRINHCTLYANLLVATHLDDDHAHDMETRALGLMDELGRAASFIRGEMLEIEPEAMQAAYREMPGLEVFRPYIENLQRRADRVLGAEAERVLGLLGDNQWAEIDLNEIPSGHETSFGALLTDIQWPMVHDEDGNEVQMTLASYGRFRGSPDREVRREAVAKFFATLRQYQHAFASTLGGQFEFTVALAQSRGYDSALEAYLDKDGLTPAVYRNLIETVNANLEPLHRYMALRKRAMGLDELHLYDLYRPLTEGFEVDVTFDEASKGLMKALQPLGPAYLEVLERGMDPANGWIDVYPNAHKRSGAFSASVYGRHPYVLMNFQNSQDDMSTLAHEYGHAVHSHLAMNAQPYSSYRYVPFLAEIASTCNEALLSDYLVANAKSDGERAYLLADRMESIRTTIYRQTLFAEFELAVHSFIEQGTPITATLLDETYADLVRRYYGPSYTLDPDDGMEWAYIPHFYYKYYVFTYATGLSSGIAIADGLRGDNAEDVQAGLVAMLSGGASEPPLDLLRKAGVDLTRPAAIEAALKAFEQTVAEMEKLID